ncbi:MAG: lysylphosphatidylglycerol synthase transmembrane domain-containing protein, partial [Chthoniobacterales bacterium]
MKKLLITLIQLAVTVAVLYWVFHDPAKRAQMGVALRNANYSWIVAAIFAYILVEVAAGVRWQILLKVQKIHLSLPRVSGLFLIGMFYNQFLPGGTGGDIIKTYLLLKEAPAKKLGALLAVMFDRLIGLVGLITITGCLIGLRYNFLAQTPETRQLLFGLLIILGSAVLALVTSFIISGFNLLHLLPERIPGREKLIELSAAYHLYAHHWFATFCAFCTSIVAHLSTFLTFFCVAKA